MLFWALGSLGQGLGPRALRARLGPGTQGPMCCSRLWAPACYKGFVGIEFEGEISEEQGIIHTRDLLLNVGKQLV